MAIARVRCEFRMKLAGKKPWMIRDLNHLDKVINGQTGKTNACRFQLLSIVVVHLKAMAMTFFTAPLSSTPSASTATGIFPTACAASL